MVDEDALKAWFVGEVLPVEPALTRYLQRNWRDGADIGDLRQEVYARVCEAALAQLPGNAKAFVFATARNHLADRARRGRIVSFDLVADLESVAGLEDAVTPERVLGARQELRILQEGLDTLPRRCRQVVVLRKVEGLSQKETAHRLGVSVGAVEQQTTKGMRALVAFLLGRGVTAASDQNETRRQTDEAGT